MYLRIRLKKIFFVFLSVLMIMCTPLSAIGEEIPSAYKTSTSITWDNPTDELFGPRSSYNVKVTLKDADGNPLKNKKLSWTSYSTYVEINTTTTDEDGSSVNKIKMQHNNKNMSYSSAIMIIYDGDGDYEHSRLDISLRCYDTASPTPAPKSTAITAVEPLKGPFGPSDTEGYAVEVILKDIYGNPIAHRYIKWSAENVTMKNVITITDEFGKSSNIFQVTRKDKKINYDAKITAGFSGDGYIASSYTFAFNCYDEAPTTPEPTGGAGYTISGYISNGISGDSASLNGFDVILEGSESSTLTRRNDLAGRNGFFSFNTPYNTGKLIVSKKGYLTRTVMSAQFVLKSGENEIERPAIVIYAGDVNQDNSINMTDIIEIASAFNSIKGSEKYKEVCDFNNDNAINLTDVMIAASHFNKITSDYDSL